MVALTILAISQYVFTPSVSNAYDVSIEMNGTLPILGGKEGKASIEFLISVTGLTPDAEMRPRAEYQLVTFRTKMNGSLLPFGLSSVQDFFPKSTFTFAKSGEVLSTTAPKKSLPASMPGLDSQCLPETTFMPVVFGASDSWNFERTFNGAKIRYWAASKLISESEEECTFSASQNLKSWEDSSNRPIQSIDGAAFEVNSKLDAKGRATFDPLRKCLVNSKTTVLIEGDAVHLESKQSFHRKLTLTVICTLVEK